MRFRAVPILDQTGKIKEWLGTGFDITARQNVLSALQESEARLRQMVDRVPNLLWEAKTDGTILLPNQQSIAYTGQAADTANWLNALHPDDVDESRRAVQNGLAGYDASYREQRIRGAAGTYRWVLVHLSPYVDGGGPIPRWFGSATDIDDMHEWRARRDSETPGARADDDPAN